jgi:hypothetical protein
LVKFSIFTRRQLSVKKPEFLKVLQHFANTSVEEAEALLNLKADFPFSQVLHILSARVSKDHELENSKFVLQLAAVYSADRAVLKGFMENEKGISHSNNVSTNSSDDLDLASTVMEDLAKLSQLRQNFELLFTGGPASFQSPISSLVETDEHEVVKESIKSKKERIVQLAKSFVTPVQDTILEVEPGFKSKRRKKDAMDTFIDQIVISKQELTPESEKHKEQIEMIDHFIKIQPSITGSKEKPAQNDDLTTIKTGEFGDHIVSETLVEILLKQGKKEKAVEVLKKLIWKFPQKKAYFAAQIEELRK